jgi:mRNA interferase RelE/StbE
LGSEKKKRTAGSGQRAGSMRAARRYSVQLKPAAVKGLEKLDRADQARVAQKIDQLKEDPLPHGVEKIRGSEALWRVRVGDFRIVYTIVRQKLLVLVVQIGNRRDIYRAL